MINSESQMLSGGADYETQVALYFVIIGNSGGVPCIVSRSRVELVHTQEQESIHSLKLWAPLWNTNYAFLSIYQSGKQEEKLIWKWNYFGNISKLGKTATSTF